MHDLRQICLVAQKLEPVLADLTAVFGIDVCHRDINVAKWGLENALLPVGRNFLEVVAPTKPDTAAGRYLKRRGGNSGYMVITETDNQKPFRDRVSALGFRTAYERIADNQFSVWQIHPADTGAAFFEIDQQAKEPGQDTWWPAGPHWQLHRREGVVRRILGVELEAREPEAVGERWAAVAGRPLLQTSAGFCLKLDNAQINFVGLKSSRGDGLSAIDLDVVDAEHIFMAARARGLRQTAQSVTICGTRFNFVTINP